MLRLVANVNRATSIDCLRPRTSQIVTVVGPGSHGKIWQSWQRHNSTVPFRKQLKEEAKLRRTQGINSRHQLHPHEHNADWKLTVGIEIHAQLSSNQKLFSEAPTSNNNEPNTHVALFDLAIPGSQPVFQKAVLLPALRAAAALDCDIQRESRFDRKHYFYQDQPAGYQITQYYAPFAKNGRIVLTAADGLGPGDGSEVIVGIKQIQLEQDTAKSIQKPPDEVLLDFNRVGHALIEIITLPQIHSPQAAAACVRKIQDILENVNAVTTGMELGGLRADVNVSVQKASDTGQHSYAGVHGLGQRTEIKNLSSFKAVEEAIIAEQKRQIDILEQGGRIEGETRGWTLGSTETRKLRGKEGEVDYRYMPDPDIAPLLLSQDLIDHVKNTLPMLPEEQTAYLSATYGINSDDAKALVLLDKGLRLDYLAEILRLLKEAGLEDPNLGRVASNWILHELGGHLKTSNTPFPENPISASSLSAILSHLTRGTINGQGAKLLLHRLFTSESHNPNPDIPALIRKHDLAIQPVQGDTYAALARSLVKEFPDVAREIRGGRVGKLQWFVGQMLRRSRGKMDPRRAGEALREVLDKDEDEDEDEGGVGSSN